MYDKNIKPKYWQQMSLATTLLYWVISFFYCFTKIWNTGYKKG